MKSNEVGTNHKYTKTQSSFPKKPRLDVFVVEIASMSEELRLTLPGVGAMNSPRYAPAGLLVERGRIRVMIDGGPRAEPKRKLIAWLVTDDRGELIREIRKLARARGLEPIVGGFSSETLSIEPKEVVHTSHPTFGYLIRSGDNKVVWAPEFFSFPAWAKGADLMFAEASGWNRPIYFRGGVGGHACVEQISKEARKYKIKRLIFAHIGRPSIRALDAGRQPAFGSLAAMALFIAWRTGKTQPRLPKVPGESYALSGETSLPASFPARPKP